MDSLHSYKKGYELVEKCILSEPPRFRLPFVMDNTKSSLSRSCFVGKRVRRVDRRQPAAYFTSFSLDDNSWNSAHVLGKLHCQTSEVQCQLKNCLIFVLCIRFHPLLILCIRSSHHILLSFTPFLAPVKPPFVRIASAERTGPLPFIEVGYRITLC
jgi:hypothetical protein